MLVILEGAGVESRSKVELFAAIRQDARVDELSIRELAEKHHVHRRTVRQALASATPPPRKVPVRTARVLESLKPTIDAVLRSDLDAPRKQRHTARRVLARLVDDHGADGLSYSTVRDYVARRPEIWAESGRTVAEAFVPPDHEFGAEGERLRRPVGDLARGKDQDPAVHVPAVRVGQGGAPGIPNPGSGGLSGRP